MHRSDKHIVIVTGTRADFGKLKPLAAVAEELGFKITFFVTGMHMMYKYGLTKREVYREAKGAVFEFINQREGDPLDTVLAKTILGFSDFVREMKPDLIIIHGDRIEALACASVAATNYVLCAHVEGGEVSGTIDEVFRHCNTKLCHVHLVSSERARGRILQLGEREESVYVLGSPELDLHAKPSGVSIEKVIERYDIPFDDFGIVIFHSVTSEQGDISDQADTLFSALAESGRNFVIILPNNDPGSSHVFEIIHNTPAERFRIIPSMRFAYFSELLKRCKAIIGNSSVGVREAPFLGVPSLDVGSRQSDRSQAQSITHIVASDTRAIGAFLEGEWGKRYRPDTAFGVGRAFEHFRRLLLNENFWRHPLQKHFTETNGGP